MAILDIENINDDIGERKIFLGRYSGFQRFDVYKYRFAKQIESKMRNAFWNPEEISMISDRIKFPSLPEHIQEIFTLNVLFQTLMDSAQSRGLDTILCSLTTSPEWEAVFRTQGYFEQIHSISYSHIIREMYPDATTIFNKIGDYPEIKHRVDSEIAAYHFAMSDLSDNDDKRKDILELLLRIFVLEGIKFYVSFLVTYKINDAYDNPIQGVNRIIKLINFDEDIHVSVFGGLLNTLRKTQDEGFVELMNSDWFKDLAKKVFDEVRISEIEWAKYLMSYGNIPGLTIKVVEQFVDYYINDRKRKLKLTSDKIDPPDIVNWFEIYKNIDLDNVAGQEGEGLAYNIGIIKDDVPSGVMVW